MIGTTCVRVLDLCLVTCYYFTLAFAISAGTDYLLGDFDPIVKSSKRTAWILASVLLHLNALVVLAAVLRAVVTSIPFPLDGAFGYSHSELRELHGGVVLGFAVFFFQRNLHARIWFLHDRVVDDIERLVGHLKERAQGLVAVDDGSQSVQAGVRQRSLANGATGRIPERRALSPAMEPYPFDTGASK